MHPPAWHYFLLKSEALFPTSWRWCCCQTGATERNPAGELLMEVKFYFNHSVLKSLWVPTRNIFLQTPSRHIYLISIAAHYAVERCLDHNKKKKQKFKLEVDKIPPKSNKLAPACDLLSFISQWVYSYLIDKDGEICDVYLVCITVPTSLCMAGLKCFALSSNVDRLASQHSAVLCCFTAVTLSNKNKIQQFCECMGKCTQRDNFTSRS